MSTPGATRSGLIRFEPSAVTGPRLLKSAMSPFGPMAPTEKTESYNASGELAVEQSGPSLPTETTTKIPAARNALAAGSSEVGSQPSIGGQPHELLRTCGALENPEMSQHVTDVLEGTRWAFDVRGAKYDVGK